MQHLGKRAWILMGMSLLAIPVSAAAVAYACTALATLHASSGTAVAGTTITVTGKFFAPHDAADIRTSPAFIRMDRLDGAALTQVSPASNGTFSVDVTVPTVNAGEHVLIATQNGIDGRPAYGTPARTVLTVEPAPVAAAVLKPAAIATLAPVSVFPPAPKPAVTTKAKKKKTMAQRVASCRSKYKVSSAKTKKGRKRVAARRASCIRLATKRTS